MKKKYTNIILGLAVLSIWFLIIKRIVNTISGDKEGSFKRSVVLNNKLPSPEAIDSIFFEDLSITVSQPFLKSSKSRTQVVSGYPNSNKTMEATNSIKIDSINLAITYFKKQSKYLGIIANKEKNRKIALFSYSGETFQISPQQVIADHFTIQGINEKEVFIEYKKRRFKVLLN